jgi:putative oxidoreductase
MKKAIPEILFRLTIGVVFAESGWGKLHHLPKVIEFFESLNIPYASLQAPFVGTLELVAGLLILFGFLVRLSSFSLIPVMVVALATAKREEITDLSSLFGLSEFLFLVILIWLTANGSRSFSVDQFLRRIRGTETCQNDYSTSK